MNELAWADQIRASLYDGLKARTEKEVLDYKRSLIHMTSFHPDPAERTRCALAYLGLRSVLEREASGRQEGLTEVLKELGQVAQSISTSGRCSSDTLRTFGDALEKLQGLV